MTNQAMELKPLFQSHRPIRLGVWGLGRGRAFYESCRRLNIEVVAGCDFNPAMRAHFQQQHPAAFVTADASQFLARPFDAVLLATYCTGHAADAIACLQAGKHVLSEVTAFHTLAEGVRLVEAVESSGLVYNLAENYPFSEVNMWLQRHWQAGLFGEFLYGEYEYVHEILMLAYTNILREPLVPGDSAHSWRSWLSFHYYNTHALGPVMYITGLRPTRVSALPVTPRMPGTLVRGHNGTMGPSPSLIALSNGAVMRSLMGSMPGDTRQQRLWGTLGSAHSGKDGLEVCLGGRGLSPRHKIVPRGDELSQYAASVGHGGGDFRVLYFFARQIHTGEPAPFDIYSACDCTLPGLLAFRSQDEGGRPYDVPDLRDPVQRDVCRNDHTAQIRYDTEKGLFPPGADRSLTTQFSTVARDLIRLTAIYCRFRDWARVAADMEDAAPLRVYGQELLEQLPALRTAQQAARQIVDNYPASDGGRVLAELLALGDAASVAEPGFISQIESVCR